GRRYRHRLGGHVHFFDPRGGTPKDHRFPFATLVTSDEDDQFSDLNRPGVFRLNVAVSNQAFQSLFPDAASARDVPRLHRGMPHPVYGKMYWVCVLNPSAATFEAVKPLLADAYRAAAGKHARREEIR